MRGEISGATSRFLVAGGNSCIEKVAVGKWRLRVLTDETLVADDVDAKDAEMEAVEVVLQMKIWQ